VGAGAGAGLKAGAGSETGLRVEMEGPTSAASHCTAVASSAPRDQSTASVIPTVVTPLPAPPIAVVATAIPVAATATNDNINLGGSRLLDSVDDGGLSLDSGRKLGVVQPSGVEGWRGGGVPWRAPSHAAGAGGGTPNQSAPGGGTLHHDGWSPSRVHAADRNVDALLPRTHGSTSFAAAVALDPGSVHANDPTVTYTTAVDLPAATTKAANTAGTANAYVSTNAAKQLIHGKAAAMPACDVDDEDDDAGARADYQAALTRRETRVRLEPLTLNPEP